MIDTKFPRIYLRDDIDVENHDGIFHARNKARDGWSKEYVSVKEMNAIIAEIKKPRRFIEIKPTPQQAQSEMVKYGKPLLRFEEIEND